MVVLVQKKVVLGVACYFVQLLFLLLVCLMHLESDKKRRKYYFDFAITRKTEIYNEAHLCDDNYLGF